MEQKCKINYHKSVVRINLKDREVMFQDGSTVKYESIISTLPLDTMVKIAEVNTVGEKGPYTSVLVFNIAAKKGGKCPSDYWVYIPKSRGGFYRVGFYSNVDVSFLPASLRNNPDRVSIYVEKAYPGNASPGDAEIQSLGKEVSKQLKEWNFISEVETISPIFVNHAYTWEYPDSKWRDEAIEILSNYHIHQIGRYGKWKFQGIAESIKDGLSAKALIRSNL
jgi:protoporphyrinogen oxidase